MPFSNYLDSELKFKDVGMVTYCTVEKYDNLSTNDWAVTSTDKN